MCACSVLLFVGLGMCSTSSSDDCACVPSSMRPRRPRKLVRCVRMFLLHRIVVVSGISTVGMWRMMLRRRCVPHSVLPGCCGDCACSVRQGPVAMRLSHGWIMCVHLSCPHVPAEL